MRLFHFGRQIRRGGVLAIILCGSFVAHIATSFASDPEGLSDLISAMENARLNIASFDAVAVYSQRLASGETLSKRIRQRHRNGMHRIDVLAINGIELGDGVDCTSWNGIEFKRYDLARKAGAVDSIALGEEWVAGLHIAQLLTGPKSGLDYTTILRERIDVVELHRTPSGILEVHAPPVPARRARLANTGFRIALHPQCQLPTRIDMEVAKGPQSVPWTSIVALHEEVAPGVWFPASAVISHRSVANGERVAMAIWILDRAALGIDIEASVFDIEFPRGTTVSELVGRRRYVVGKENR